MDTQKRKMINYRKFDDYMLEHLQDSHEAIAYLEAALEEYENDGCMEAFH